MDICICLGVKNVAVGVLPPEQFMNKSNWLKLAAISVLAVSFVALSADSQQKYKKLRPDALQDGEFTLFVYSMLITQQLLNPATFPRRVPSSGQPYWDISRGRRFWKRNNPP